MINKKTNFKKALAKFKERSDLIPILQLAQKEYSYISRDIIKEISDKTGIAVSDIYGVVTFYKQLRMTPPGMFTIKVCDGTACHVNDSSIILEKLKELLSIEIGETTADGVFTLETVACLGCCSLAPAMMINTKVHGRLTTKQLENILKEYRENKSVLDILREDR